MIYIFGFLIICLVLFLYGHVNSLTKDHFEFKEKVCERMLDIETDIEELDLLNKK